MEFPKRIYTTEEVRRAYELVKKGHRHRLRIDGNLVFKEKVREALKLVKTAGYHDFLRKYIRKIEEINGLTQLREADAAIWANKYAVQDPIDAASLFVQKAHHMKEYLEGKLYFGGASENRSVQKRIEFLETLKRRSRKKDVRANCGRLLESWVESVFL